MNPKGDLIARLILLGEGTPTFEAEAHGPAHERTFQVKVWSAGRVLAQAQGRTKKDAERLAAEAALKLLDERAEAGQVVSQDASAPLAPAPLAAGLPEPHTIWPIYAPVLAEAVEAAIEFADEGDSLEDVRHKAAQFYRELLADLGHGPEVLP